MGTSIVIASGKGGTGKTMVSANLGATLSRLGHQVIVIDMDTGLRNLDLYLGLENNVVLRNISNKLLIKTINTVNYKTEQLDLFNDCINDNYIFSNIITIESKNFIDSSKILDNCIYIDKFYNYSTLINFNTGELNMIMLVRDIIGNIYKMEYKISIDEFMKKFYISDKTKNSIILELSKENNNAFS